MIELSAEQRQAIAQGEAVRIIDPLTQDAYVVLRAKDFDCLLGIPPRPEDHRPSPEISPQMLRSQQAFWQDLPELLKKKRNRGSGWRTMGRSALRLGGRRLKRIRNASARG